MGSTWDAWVGGNTSTPATQRAATGYDHFKSGFNADREPDTQMPDAPKESAWEKLMSSTSKTHSSGDGFYSGEAKTVDADYVIQGLVERGMPEHIAEGFAMNMEDESGFQSDVNERNPTVAGSRGGFGLYQLTGPRRRQYEDFAKQRGIDPGDPDAQMDFMMWELDNTEKSARQKIWGAQSAGEAGAAIVNSFLRPAQEHREKRASKYLGGPAIHRPEPRPNKLWLDF